MKINLKNIAFTMAEMMMVMAIIGATAALTIPNLVDSYKEEQTIVKLKKMTVPMPPMSIQNEFADFVKLIDKSKFVGYFTLNIFYVKSSHFHHPP